MAATQIWQNYFTVASSALAAGEWSLAHDMFEAAMRDADSFGLSHEEAASCHGLALTLVKLNRLEEAKRLLRKAIRLYTLFTPVESRGLSASTCVLADLYCQSGDDDRAVPLLKVTKRTIAGQCGASVPELKPVLNRLAMIYARHCHGDKAKHLLMQSRQIATAS